MISFFFQRLSSKLTDQQEKIETGQIPMPMYSCLHVKKHVSAMVFHGRLFSIIINQTNHYIYIQSSLANTKSLGLEVLFLIISSWKGGRHKNI